MFLRSLILDARSESVYGVQSLVQTKHHVLAVVATSADDVKAGRVGVGVVSVGLVQCSAPGGLIEDLVPHVFGGSADVFIYRTSQYKKFSLELRQVGWFDDAGWLLWAKMLETALGMGTSTTDARRMANTYARDSALVWRDWVKWREGSGYVSSAEALGAPLFERGTLGAEIVGNYIDGRSRFSTYTKR